MLIENNLSMKFFLKSFFLYINLITNIALHKVVEKPNKLIIIIIKKKKKFIYKKK